MNFLPQTNHVSKDKLLNLLASDAYRFGDFQLSSGLKSNHYVNCKPVTLSSVGLALTSVFLLESIDLDSLAVAGLTLGADPLVSGVSLAAFLQGRNLDSLIVRKEPKGYGTEAWLEGPLPPTGSKVTVLEDVVTTGGSSIKAVNQLRKAGYEVKRVVTIVDRDEGGKQAMKNSGLELVSLFQLKEISACAESRIQ